MDPADRLGDIRAGARHVTRRPLDQVRGYERGHVTVALLGEARRVRRMLEHRGRQVGAADRLAGRAAGLERRRVDVEAEPA